MRRALILPAAAALACGGRGEPRISVGGTYQTAVAVVEKTCTEMGVQQAPTVVTHRPGDSVLTVTHAGASYQGRLKADGSFVTEPGIFAIGDTKYTITVSGSFTATGTDMRARVDADRTPPCSITASWIGPKEGAANVIP